MLSERDLATIRAALAFWRDEMTPHGIEVMRSYLEDPLEAPLDASEIDALRRRFAPGAVRIARFVAPNRLALLTRSEFLAASDRNLVAVVGDLD